MQVPSNLDWDRDFNTIDKLVRNHIKSNHPEWFMMGYAKAEK